MDLAERTGQLFAIFESQEFDGLEALLATDVKMKQNGNPEHDVDGLMAFVKGLKNDGVAVKYSDVRRSVGDGFVVEQHVVTLTRPDGKSAIDRRVRRAALRRRRPDHPPRRVRRHRRLCGAVELRKPRSRFPVPAPSTGKAAIARAPPTPSRPLRPPRQRMTGLASPAHTTSWRLLTVSLAGLRQRSSPRRH